MLKLILGYALLCGIWSFVLSKYRIYLGANFVISILVSLGYGLNKTQLGDDISYRRLAHDFDWSLVVEGFRQLDFPYVYFWLHNSGAYPTYWLLDFLQLSYTNGHLFMSGTIIHSFSLFILYLTVLDKWQLALKDHRLLALLLTGPVILTLTAAPTRHMFTLLGLALIYFWHSKKIRNKKLTFLLIIIILGLSKPIYLAIFLLFISFFNGGAIIKALVIFIVGVIINSEIVSRYLIQAEFHFGLDLTNPFFLLLLYPVKLIYAAFGPFPHYNVALNTRLFGDNYWLYFMQLLSIIITTYSILYTAYLVFSRKKVDSTFVLFLILSLSVAGGSRSFHGYLSILVPFILVKLPNLNRTFYFLSIMFIVSANLIWLLV